MKTKVKIYSPVKGKIIPITEVPDKNYASKSLGDGFAVSPESNILLSPVNGEIKMIYETLHAFGIKTEEGLNVLVHFGLEASKLSGRGFKSLAKIGDVVTVGTPILEVDFEKVKDTVTSDLVVVVITGFNKYKILKRNYDVVDEEAMLIEI